MTGFITINGEQKKIRASALLPKLYRYNFGADLMRDMAALEKVWQKSKQDGDKSALYEDALPVFERLTWLMLKQGGEDVGTSLDEWLDGLDDTFTVYEAIPQVLAVWVGNLNSTSSVKKK